MDHATDHDTAPGPAERGRELERAVADYFAVHGYAVRRNAILVGRSGARHEIDVLAERTDPVVRVTVAVECKAHAGAVATEPIARLDWMVRDVALDKALIVCPGGITPAATESARDLGIEVWGPGEVDARLDLGARAPGPQGPRGRAWRATMDGAAAHRAVNRESGGLFGLGRERVTAEGACWLGWHALEVSEPVRAGLLRPRLRAHGRWLLYDCLEGRIVRSLEDDPAEELDHHELAGARLPIVTTAERIEGAIRAAARRRDEVVSAAARRRHERRLEELGLPAEAASPRVEGRRLVWQPLWLALLESRAGRRAVAVDLAAGRRDPELEELLTGRAADVEAALEGL